MIICVVFETNATVVGLLVKWTKETSKGFFCSREVCRDSSEQNNGAVTKRSRGEIVVLMSLIPGYISIILDVTIGEHWCVPV
jgi:hypothetical protein